MSIEFHTQMAISFSSHAFDENIYNNKSVFGS